MNPTPSPGWYPDPSGNGGQRYWDGGNWAPATAPQNKRGDARLIAAICVAVPLLLAGGCVAVGTIGSFGRDDSKPTGTSSQKGGSSSQPPATGGWSGEIVTTTPRALPGDPIPPSPGEAYKIGGFGNKVLQGIYEAPGAVAGGVCVWVIQRDLVGNESSVIDRGFGAPGEPMRVGLRDGQYFTSDGCGTWVRVGRIE